MVAKNHLMSILSRLMAVTDVSSARLWIMGWQIGVAAAAAMLAWRGYWPVALCVVVAAELWPMRRRLNVAALNERATALVISMSAVLIIALLPKVVAQAAAGLLYITWAVWRTRTPAATPISFSGLLAVQALLFEAIFLLAAIWHPPRPLLLLLVWAGSYVTVVTTLEARGERAAGLLAAAWALVVTEAAWVFLTWLVSYIVPGAYVIVPQPTLVLTALAYCFGNIYLAQRAGTLNRARLTEYLLIGLILIWVVIAGTPWRGTLD